MAGQPIWCSGPSVPVDQPVGRHIAHRDRLANCVHGTQLARIARSHEEEDQWYQEDGGVEGVGTVSLHKRCPAGMESLRHDFFVNLHRGPSTSQLDRRERIGWPRLIKNIEPKWYLTESLPYTGFADSIDFELAEQEHRNVRTRNASE